MVDAFKQKLECRLCRRELAVVVGVEEEPLVAHARSGDAMAHSFDLTVGSTDDDHPLDGAPGDASAQRGMAVANENRLVAEILEVVPLLLKSARLKHSMSYWP